MQKLKILQINITWQPVFHGSHHSVSHQRCYKIHFYNQLLKTFKMYSKTTKSFTTRNQIYKLSILHYIVRDSRVFLKDNFESLLLRKTLRCFGTNPEHSEHFKVTNFVRTLHKYFEYLVKQCTIKSTAQQSHAVQLLLIQWGWIRHWLAYLIEIS